MKKILVLGSVAGIVPAKKQGGTENVVYTQVKQLAKHGVSVILVAGIGSERAFLGQLQEEKEDRQILEYIEFVEIGGSTQFGNADGSFLYDPSQMEASRLLRMEMVNLAKVQQLLIKRAEEYSLILSNMRGESIFLPLVNILQKPFITVMHLPLFKEFADLLSIYNTQIVTISNIQREGYKHLNYLATIHNPVNTHIYSFNPTPKNYAVMVATIAHHKNQKDAIIAAKQAGIPLVLVGKIRDQSYFDEEIKPNINGTDVIYMGELGFLEKLKLYQEAKVFLFPILWQEPFGLVLIEAMSCGTPVISYPNGGPTEIITEGNTGFFVQDANQMAIKIKEIGIIDRKIVRNSIEQRFSEEVVGKMYYDTILPYLK